MFLVCLSGDDVDCGFVNELYRISTLVNLYHPYRGSRDMSATRSSLTDDIVHLEGNFGRI